MKTLCTILAAVGIYGLLAVEGATFTATIVVKAVSTIFLLPGIWSELKKEGRA